MRLECAKPVGPDRIGGDEQTRAHSRRLLDGPHEGLVFYEGTPPIQPRYELARADLLAAFDE